MSYFCPHCGNLLEDLRTPLTKQMRAVKDFIEDFMVVHDGMSPTFAEIAKGIGLKSKSGAHRLVTDLEERGHVRRLTYRARSIQIVEHVS